MTRKSQPALYERMRAAQPSGVPRPAIAVPTREPPDLDDGVGAPRWLRPGQSVRLPVGYIMLACGVSVLLVAAAYMVGHQRGVGIARAQYEAALLRGGGGAGGGAGAGGIVNDPLRSLDPLDQPGGGDGSRETATLSGANDNRGAPPRAQAPGRRPSSQWGPITPAKDPRMKGLNYWVMATTNEEGGIRLAEHARAQGLETYVVPVNNSRSRRVIAFPGFDLSKLSRTSPEVTAIRDWIHQIGASWKKDKRGDSDLRDAYLDKYE